MKNTHTIDIEHAVAPGLLRRLAAIFYDSLLLFGVLALATAIAMIPLGQGPGKEIAGDNPFFQIYLVVITVAFFSWFWTHGGQTLGMQVWRVRVVRRDGGVLTLGNALLRYLAALLSWIACGLGFLWIILDKDKLAWHDRLSGTQLVLVAKPCRR